MPMAASPARAVPRLLALLAGLVLACTPTSSAVASEPLQPPRFAPRQRLTRERLAAVDASVQALASQRRDLPPPKPWRDLRAIFHAHAEDSSHTGGTRPEMLADARAAGIDVLFLSDHFRPPRDFMDSWRMATNGVLFIPGSECRGFLAHPDRSVMGEMEVPIPRFVEVVGSGTGMIFLSHAEERLGHDMTGLTGMEIYNRHHDAKRDVLGMLDLATRLTDPAGLRELQEITAAYPDAVLGAQVEYPALYLDKWDRETPTRRLVGVGANDCHHNQVFVLQKVDAVTARLGTAIDKPESMRELSVALRPGLVRILQGLTNGAVLRLLDVDPYRRAFRCVTTHVWAPEVTEPALRAAVRAGHAFVAHAWMGDATGFRMAWMDASEPPMSDRVRAWMGDEASFQPGGRIDVESPLPGQVRLLRDGKEVARTSGVRLSHPVDQPGVYRAEVWLELGGEWRGWTYSNPVYLR